MDPSGYQKAIQASKSQRRRVLFWTIVVWVLGIAFVAGVLLTIIHSLQEAQAAYRRDQWKNSSTR